MLDNLELLIRSYGDGTGKKRNYDFQDMNFDAEQYTAEGGNLVTGEYIDGAESSLARCLILRLKKGDVDKDKLSFLQNNSIMLEHFLVSYIASLSEIINNRVPLKTTNYKSYRMKNGLAMWKKVFSEE